MKILFAVPYLPSPVRVRSYNFIKELARRGHEITLISLRDKNEEPDKPLKDACTKTITIPASKLHSLLRCGVAFLRNDSLWVASCRSQAVQSVVSEECRKTEYDILHIEHIRGTSLVNGASAKARIFDAVDCMEPLLSKIAQHKKNPLARRMIKLESQRVGRKESELAPMFDRVLITSDKERNLLLEKAPKAVIDVVPIGVDLSKFQPCYENRVPNRIIFTGKMSYFPNADGICWFVSNVFPKLLERHPGITLTIAGADPGPSVCNLRNVKGVEVTGFVPDLQPLLESSGIAICPLRIAAGAQLKIVEAMACGLPVVASPLTSQIMNEDCKSLLTAVSADDWVRTISLLIDNPEHAVSLGMRNHDYVERNLSWRNSVDKLEYSYNKALVSSEESEPASTDRALQP